VRGHMAKKHKLAHDMPMVGSPVSTLEMSVDFGVPLSSCPSPKRTESSPPSPPSEENVSSSPGLSRKNRPQRCSICKECGHKSRTCRFAQGKVEVPPVLPHEEFPGVLG